MLERFMVQSCDIEVAHVTLMTSGLGGGGPGALFFPAHQKWIQISRSVHSKSRDLNSWRVT